MIVLSRLGLSVILLCIQTFLVNVRAIQYIIILPNAILSPACQRSCKLIGLRYRSLVFGLTLPQYVDSQRILFLID